MQTARRLCSWVLVVLPVALAFGRAQAAPGPRPLREELGEAARAVADTLKLLRLKSISEPTLQNLHGPRGAGEEQIRRTFIEEIGKNKIAVEPVGDAQVLITYAPARVPDPLQPHDRKFERAGTRLRVVLTRGEDPPLSDKTYQAVGLEDMVGSVGVHGNFQAATVLQVEEKAVKLARSKPRTHIDRAAVLPDKDSPYGVEVLVGGTPRTPEDRGGAAFVKLNKGEVYTIRLVNRSANEVAVRLTIDGVSVFAFSKLRQERGKDRGQPLLSAVLVPPRGSVVVPGWQHTEKEMFRFKIGLYPESAAAKLGVKSDSRQAVTAQFAAAWEKDKDPPADEPGLTKGSGGYGTLKGDPIKASNRVVERMVGTVRAAVTVRYDVPE